VEGFLPKSELVDENRADTMIGQSRNLDPAAAMDPRLALDAFQANVQMEARKWFRPIGVDKLDRPFALPTVPFYEWLSAS